MHPELPFLAAGAVSIIGGTIKSHGLPPNVDRSVIGTIVLVIAASATADTHIGPLVHAIGMLLLLAAVMASVKAASTAKVK